MSSVKTLNSIIELDNQLKEDYDELKSMLETKGSEGLSLEYNLLSLKAMMISEFRLDLSALILNEMKSSRD